MKNKSFITAMGFIFLIALIMGIYGFFNSVSLAFSPESDLNPCFTDPYTINSCFTDTRNLNLCFASENSHPQDTDDGLIFATPTIMGNNASDAGTNSQVITENDTPSTDTGNTPSVEPVPLPEISFDINPQRDASIKTLLLENQSISDCELISFGNTLVVAIKTTGIFRASAIRNLIEELTDRINEKFPELENVFFLTRVKDFYTLKGLKSRISENCDPIEIYKIIIEMYRRPIFDPPQMKPMPKINDTPKR